MLIASHRRWLGVFTVAFLMAASTTGAGPLPATTYPKVIDADVEHMMALVELHKGEPKNKNFPAHIRATAMLIASYAQDNFDGKDADRMAALRAQALKVAEAVAKKDMDGMMKAAADLKTVKADAAADKKPVKLSGMHKTDLREIMNLFGKPRNGGMNIEADIRAQKKDGVKDPKAAEIIAARSLAIAQFATDLTPTFTAKRTKSDWERWNQDMKDQSIALAAEAAKGPKSDAAKLKKIMSSLDASCVSCHNVFKEP